MRTLRAGRQLAMLFVTYSIALSRHIADNLVVLNKGKIVDYGPTAQVLENPTHEYTRAADCRRAEVLSRQVPGRAVKSGPARCATMGSNSRF